MLIVCCFCIFWETKLRKNFSVTFFVWRKHVAKMKSCFSWHCFQWKQGLKHHIFVLETNKNDTTKKKALKSHAGRQIQDR